VVPTALEWAGSDVEGESLQKNLQRLGRPDEDGFFAVPPGVLQKHTMNERDSLERDPRSTPKPHNPDFWVSSHGTISLVHPLTKAARRWLEDHCPCGEDHLYFGGALVVEPRYLENLLVGMAGDALRS